MLVTTTVFQKSRDMPTTRAQEAAEKRGQHPEDSAKHTATQPTSNAKKPASTRKPPSTKKGAQPKAKTTQAKRGPEAEETRQEEPAAKKVKTETEQSTKDEQPHRQKEGSEEAEADKENAPARRHPAEGTYQAGTHRTAFVSSPRVFAHGALQVPSSGVTSTSSTVRRSSWRRPTRLTRSSAFTCFSCRGLLSLPLQRARPTPSPRATTRTRR